MWRGTTHTAERLRAAALATAQRLSAFLAKLYQNSLEVERAWEEPVLQWPKNGTAAIEQGGALRARHSWPIPTSRPVIS